MATISGTVKDSTGAFASRLVRAYRRSDGAKAGEAVSDATTGAYSITALDGTPHFAVTHDGGLSGGDTDWGSTVLAMHMDGVGLTDVKGHAVTLNGNVTRSATQSKFGGYSAYFDGAGDYLVVENAADIDLLASDFTIELWVWFNTNGVNQGVISGHNLASGFTPFLIYCVSGNLCFYASSNSTSWDVASGVVVKSGVVVNTWHHVVVCRSGGSIRLFCNGTLENTVSFSGSLMSNGGNTPSIGKWANSNYLNGYIDDLRITKGVARYTADFIPPTQAFPNTVGVPGSPTENALIFDNITPV